MKKLFIILILFSSCSITFAQINMVFLETGSFSMGSNDDEDEQPVHAVHLSSFYIGRYEVTNQEAVDVFNFGIESRAIYADETTVKNNYGDTQQLLDLDADYGKIEYRRGKLSVPPDYENHPVINISWYGAAVFCNLLSEMNDLEPAYDISDWSWDNNSKGYRLPTEAEWEYASKGGINNDNYIYSGSNSLDEVSNIGFTLLPGGEKSPNSRGIYDMSGNVQEWCWDFYKSEYYSNSPRRDPPGPPNDYSKAIIDGREDMRAYRILRGGAYTGSHDSMRCSAREYTAQFRCKHSIGFRIAVTVAM